MTKRTKSQKEDLQSSIGCILIVVLVLMVIAAPFRLYSSLNALSSMTAPRVQEDLGAPNNLPALSNGSHIILVKPASGISIDLVFALTGELIPWNTVKLDNGGTAVLLSGESPVQLHFKFSNGFNPLGGNWRGHGARMHFVGDPGMTIEGIPGNINESWGGAFGISSDPKEVMPDFDISIPLEILETDSDIAGRAHEVNLEMDIAYPTFATSSSYEDREGAMTHTINLIVLSTEETDEYLKIRKDYLTRQIPMTAASWLAAPVSAGFLVILYVRRNRKLAHKTVRD